MNSVKAFETELKINGIIGNVLKILSLQGFSNFGSNINNSKFPPLDIKEISEKIKRLKMILKINKKIEFKLVSKRTMIIKIF